LSDLSDENLGKTEPDQAIRDDFNEAMRNSTIVSLSGFVRRHSDSIRVKLALARIWQLLLVEFPSDRFVSSITFFQLVFPKDQRVSLPLAVANDKPFVISFAPATVPVGQEVSVDVQFRELAGRPATLNKLFAAATMAEGKLYFTVQDVSVSIPSYGQGHFKWSCYGMADSKVVNLEFGGPSSELATISKVN